MKKTFVTLMVTLFLLCDKSPVQSIFIGTVKDFTIPSSNIIVIELDNGQKLSEGLYKHIKTGDSVYYSDIHGVTWK